MNVSIIVDNNAAKPLVAEHGLAMLLEYQGKRILFDTGKGEALFENARQMGIDLSNLDAVILSHGHYDHGGNIERVLKLNPTVPFVAHPNCTIPRYSLHEGKPVKSVALTNDNKRAIIEKNHAEITWCYKPTELLDGLWITGEIPRKTSYETTGGPFYLDPKKERKDLLPDDMALWIDHGDSLSVVTGCCHSGIVNTIEFIQSTAGKPVTSVIGGLHLVNADENRMKETVAFFKESSVQQLIPLHCTGDEAVAILKSELSSVVSATAGDRVDLSK